MLSRRSYTGTLIALAFAVSGCTASGSEPHTSPSVSVPSASAGAGATAASTKAATSDGSPQAESASAALGGLKVQGRAPMTGYARDKFGPAWTDDNNDPLGHNGCDTRNDILRRDLVTIQLKPGTGGCVVLTGVLHDPYTGHTISFTRGASTSAEVQIDHVVALGDAWQLGAQKWTAATRTDFANDPLELLAVDGPTNNTKGDSDAASWLPPAKGDRCSYVARQIGVKARYGLAVTRAEHDAMAHVLSSCPSQLLPVE